ncbi:Protein yjbJ [plant metagenome]|uniref:Protein yjbJ n=2 Tax=root TaxID=1 RepID=A0A1C3K020_9BURK|nr:Protein yjbJ [Orrella dioscoreae]SOE50622.1 Protein yjbJ [Orrella dioscoreae]
MAINQDILEGKWKQIAGKVKAKWGDLTDDDITKVNGNAERLAGVIQERYGKTREQADKEARDFFDQHR